MNNFIRAHAATAHRFSMCANVSIAMTGVILQTDLGGYGITVQSPDCSPADGRFARLTQCVVAIPRSPRNELKEKGRIRFITPFPLHWFQPYGLRQFALDKVKSRSPQRKTKSLDVHDCGEEGLTLAERRRSHFELLTL